MQSLTMDEIEQVGGGLTYSKGPYGVFIMPGDLLVQPAPGPVIGPLD